MWQPRPRQPLTGLALCALVGIFAAEWWSWPLVWVLAILVIAAAIALVRRSTMACWLACIAAFFILHSLQRNSAAAELARTFSAGRTVVQARGIVCDEPEASANMRGPLARFPLALESLTIDGTTSTPRVTMNVRWAGKAPAYGDRVSILGSAQNLGPTRNPGEFDSTGYQQRKGIFTEISAQFPEDCVIESHGHGNRVQAFAYQASHWIQHELARDLENEPEISALIASMVLGLRGDTPPKMKALFQRTGTMHLFAVSGLNVAMLAGIVIFVLKTLRVPRQIAIVAAIPLLAFYALVTGLSASCVRATIMTTLVLLAMLFDRRPLALNSLAAAALAILLWDTNQLFSPGFQFSFALVIAIVAFSGKIERWCAPAGRPDPFLPRELWSWRQRAWAWKWHWFAATLGVTISAWLGSLVFTAGYFHLFSPSALLANLIAVPIAFAMLVVGIATLLVTGFSTSAAMLCNNANWLCAKALLWVLEMIALLPGGFVYVEKPHFAPAPAAEFTVLDLGEGGAIFLRCGRRDWLLDCGGGAAYDHVVLPYLRTRGVNALDAFLLTHGDAKHIGSALDVLEDFRPRLIVDSVLKDRATSRRYFHQELERRALGKGIYERGDVIDLGAGAQLRVLYPPAGIKRAVADDMALVVRFECAGTRALFMADSGFPTEQWLVENEADLRADILVKGQHAKDISGTPEFLARVQPQAVICGTLGYGESPEKLDAWERDVVAKGIAVYRQDRCGAVQVDLRANGYEIRPWLVENGRMKDEGGGMKEEQSE